VNTSPRSLQELIDLAVGYDGSSVRELARKAQGAGFKVTYTTLHQIRNGTYKSTPKDETLRAIAYLARVDDSKAFAAAGQPVPGPPLADELPPGVDLLPAKSRKVLIDMARVLVDLNQDVNRGQADTDPNSAPHADELAARRRAGEGQKSLEPDDSGNIPLPPNWQDLAAGAPHESQIRREREWSERGEESQDLDADE